MEWISYLRGVRQWELLNILIAIETNQSATRKR
jgi:hypothetical protein